MRERLDCAVLLTTDTAVWANPEHFPGDAGRLHLQPLCPEVNTYEAGSTAILAANVMQLRRFDACLLAVSPENLVWARTSLSVARSSLRTPVLALCRGLKACALNDLYQLGVTDFVRDPFCVEELRIRVERMLDRQRRPAISGMRQGGCAMPAAGRTGLQPLSHPGPVEPGTPAVGEPAINYAIIDAGVTAEDICDNILERSGAELEAFAIASASRYATSAEPFGQAKSQVIERFERAYITAALSRHSGNIAMAARSAQKHRRAFWALMRKHEIDAARFRANRARRPPDR